VSINGLKTMVTITGDAGRS